MVESIRDKISQILQHNEKDIKKEDYTRLVVYIDLLSNFAAGYETITKNCLQIASK